MSIDYVTNEVQLKHMLSFVSNDKWDYMYFCDRLCQKISVNINRSTEGLPLLKYSEDELKFLSKNKSINAWLNAKKALEKTNDQEHNQEKSEAIKFIEGCFKAERLNREINLEIMSYVYGPKTESDTKKHYARMKEILKNPWGLKRDD